MTEEDLPYQPVIHDHEAFLKESRKKPGFEEAYQALEEEYVLADELLSQQCPEADGAPQARPK